MTSSAISQRALAALLITVEAAALGYLSQTVVYPAVISVFAWYMAMTRSRWRLSQQRLFDVSALLAIAFLVKHGLAPEDSRYNGLFIRSPMALVVGQYILALQVVHFFRESDDDRLPIVLPGMGVIAMVCTAIVQVDARERIIFQLLVIAFAVVSSLYLGSCRRWIATGFTSRRGWRTAILVVLVLLVSGGTWASATALFRYERRIESLLSGFLRPERHSRGRGFSGQAVLGEVMRRKSDGANSVALRVMSDTEPGYLRGRAFESYANSEWSTMASLQSVTPLAKLPPGLPSQEQGEQLFIVRSAEPGEWKTVEVWPETRFQGVLFSPLGTTVIQARTPDVLTNLHEVFESDEILPGRPYTMHVPGNAAPEVLTEMTVRRLTALPSIVDPRVRELAADLFADCRTQREKIAAVRRYFLTNYQYALEIDVPSDEDPVTWFLLHRPAAYCEYFATGTALLLRLGGVPCRYVTGFVAAEYNESGEYWVARNRDAHAWVEVYDEARGWVIIESTPSEGIPTSRDASRIAEMWDSFRIKLRMLRMEFRRKGMQAVLDSLLILVQSRQGQAGAVVIASVLGCFALRNRRKRSRVTVRDPVVTELQKLLGRADARLRRQRLERRPGETLHQFAARIDQPALADWYRSYAAVRYGGAASRNDVRELRRELLRKRSIRRRAASRAVPVRSPAE